MKLKNEIIFPKWSPASIVRRIGEYEDFYNSIDNSGVGNATYKMHLRSRIDMWIRLVTRIEMQAVWKFISERVHLEELDTNGGLFGHLERQLNNLATIPHLSAKEYEKEMLEIAALSRQLSNKVRKFCDVPHAYQPFTHAEILLRDGLAKAAKMIDKKFELDKKSPWNTGYILDFHLPRIDLYLDALSEKAKTESKTQSYRPRALPRKTKAENAFRTLFITLVGEYFTVYYADYSPSRLAIFCSVALDDSSITPDLIRKLYKPEIDKDDLHLHQQILVEYKNAVPPVEREPED